MVFLKNWSFFHFLFFNNIGRKNVFYDIVERKNAFLGNKNKKYKKSKNWYFCKGVNPWFCSKIGHFFILFFFRQYRPGKCFCDILERKNAFLGNKNKKFEKSKNWHFSKGVSPWFSLNIGHFSIFFLKLIKARKISFMIF